MTSCAGNIAHSREQFCNLDSFKPVISCFWSFTNHQLRLMMMWAFRNESEDSVLSPAEGRPHRPSVITMSLLQATLKV